MPALGVVSLSISFAIIWEFLINKITKRTISIGDGNAALIGLLFGMLLPATSPWWLVITGTFVAVVIGKHIYGGIGGNPFNPVLIGFAILMVAWKDYFDFNEVLVNYDLGGGIGSTFGLGLIIGGIYLILRGFIRWEISVSFLAGIGLTALMFNMSDPSHYASPVFHLLTGYTLIGAFFLAAEDSSSPVNFIPMLIYGAGAGVMTVLIRNLGSYVDGVVFAILLMNLINPICDKIRPKALGKVV
jgi:electron transport complex protein RnfD